MITGITEEQLLQGRIKIGKQLAALIEGNDSTVSQLSIDKTYLDDMKKGVVNFDINKLALLSKALGFEIVLKKVK